MEKEIKARKKRFVAFWAAVLMIGILTLPMFAYAVDYVNDAGIVVQGQELTAGTEIRAQSITYLNSDGTAIGTGAQGSGGWQAIMDYPEELPSGTAFRHWLVQSVSEETAPAESGYGDVHYPVLVTLRPVLETILYTITFNTDGGSEIPAITQAFGTAVTAPAAPTKTGHTFAGWDQEIPTTMPAGDVTITAQWTVNQYTITFDTAGGSEITPITQDYGTAITPPDDPTRENYYFMGWDTAIPDTMPGENITITAKWTPYVIDAGTYELKQGVEYKLGNATKVSGDSSTYAGGSIFYVPADGSYTFS